MLPSGNLREGYTIYRSDSFAGMCVCARVCAYLCVYATIHLCSFIEIAYIANYFVYLLAFSFFVVILMHIKTRAMPHQICVVFRKIAANGVYNLSPGPCVY